MRFTRSPRASRRHPMEAAARPFPNEDTTPPVTKMYFADMSATSLDELEVCAWCARLSIAGLSGRSKWQIVCLENGPKWRQEWEVERRAVSEDCEKGLAICPPSLRFAYEFPMHSLWKKKLFFM